MQFITLADGVSVNMAHVTLITRIVGFFRLMVTGMGQEMEVRDPKDIETIEKFLNQ